MSCHHNQQTSTSVAILLVIKATENGLACDGREVLQLGELANEMFHSVMFLCCFLDMNVSIPETGDWKSSVLFINHPRSDGWKHHGRTFSIYLCPLSFWLTLPRGVLSMYWLMLSIQAVHGLPRLRAPGIVPCITSFSMQPPCFLMVWPDLQYNCLECNNMQPNPAWCDRHGKLTLPTSPIA